MKDTIVIRCAHCRSVVPTPTVATADRTYQIRCPTCGLTTAFMGLVHMPRTETIEASNRTRTV